MAIILVTLAIRLVLLPLTWKQTKSMVELQRIQPKIKELQVKHKDDKEKLQEETLKFYQENKVNPFGGCLPLLLQMPVLFALYGVLGARPQDDDLHRLADLGNSVIIIEHNLDVIRNADWVVDLGPEGGEDGGRVVGEGRPAKIAATPGSYTGQFLKRYYASANGRLAPVEPEEEPGPTSAGSNNGCYSERAKRVEGPAVPTPGAPGLASETSDATPLARSSKSKKSASKKPPHRKKKTGLP